MARPRLIWGLWLIAVVAVYLYSDHYAALLLLIVSVVVPIVLTLPIWFARRFLSVGSSLVQTVTKGQAARVKLTIKNTGLLPYPLVRVRLGYENLLTGEGNAEDIFTSIGPRQTKEVEVFLKSRYCGTMRLTLAFFNAYDPFGIFGKKHLVEESSQVVVLPDTFHLEVEVSEARAKDIDADEYSPYKPGSDMSETFAIREYKEGDSLKSIHWKLTSKMQSLMVKDPSLPIKRSLLILMETSAREGEPVLPEVRDALAEAAVSIGQALSGQDIPYEIGWQNQDEQVFFKQTVPSFEELAGVLPKLLGASVKVDEMNCLDHFADTYGTNEFDHTVYLSWYVPHMLEGVGTDGLLTMIICGTDASEEAFPSDEAQVYFCTPNDCATALQYVVI